MASWPYCPFQALTACSPHRLSEARAVSPNQDVLPDNARDRVDHPMALPPSETEIPSLVKIDHLLMIYLFLR